MAKTFVSKLLPFNGSCRASEDSDLVLEFDDQSVLKTHRFLLSRVSPIFEGMLDCPECDVVRLCRTESLPWRIILNLIFPLSPLRDGDLLRDDALDDVLRQAVRYNIICVLTRVENAILHSLVQQAQERRANTLLSAMLLRDEKRLMIIASRYNFCRAKAATIRIMGCIIGTNIRRGSLLMRQGKWLSISGVEFRIDDLRKQGYEDVFAFFESIYLALNRST